MMYEDSRKIMLPAIHRSGHHAIAVWLLHQAEGVDKFDIGTMCEWWHYLRTKEGLRLFFNNPPNSKIFKILTNFKKNTIIDIS